MEHHNIFHQDTNSEASSFFSSKRRWSDLHSLSESSSDTSKSLLNYFDMESLTDPSLDRCSLEPESNTDTQSHHSLETQLSDIGNILEKGIKDDKEHAINDLSKLICTDSSVVTKIENHLIQLLVLNLSSGSPSLCNRCADCLIKLITASSKIRDYLFQLGTFEILHSKIDSSTFEDSDILFKCCTSFLNTDVYPSPLISKMVLSSMERWIDPGKMNESKIQSFLLILFTVSYFSKSKDADILKSLSIFIPFISNLRFHSDESVSKNASMAYNLIVPPTHLQLNGPSEMHDKNEPLDFLPILNPITSPTYASPLMDVPISPNTSKNSPKIQQHGIFSLFLSDESLKRAQNTLWEADVTICQSVELFKSCEIDVRNQTCCVTGQIGLRCIYCKNSPFKKIPFSTVFPDEVMMIAPSLRHIAKDHLVKCLSAPPGIRHDLNVSLQSDNANLVSFASLLEKFCLNVGTECGLKNMLPTGSGISLRESSNSQQGCSKSFSRIDDDNMNLNLLLHSNHTSLESTKDLCYDSQTMPLLTLSVNDILSPFSNKNCELNVNHENMRSHDYAAIMNSHKGKSSIEILIGNDREMITDYLAFFLQQLSVCYFTRSKYHKQTRVFKEWFPGVECMHCKDKKMNRQFFWSSGSRYVNSSREIPKHLLSCKYCPEAIKNELNLAKETHIKQIKELPLGSITAFFHRLFRRLMNELASDGKDIPPHIAHIETELNSIEEHSLSKLTSSKIVLHIESEDKWFSEKEILLRKCIEIFCITAEDINLIKNKLPERHVIIDQVCLRCIYCSNGDFYSDSSAFFFPSSMEKIRTDAFRFQQHLKECKNAPDYVKQRFKSQQAYSHSKEKLNMWIQSAESLGLFSMRTHFGDKIIKSHSLGEPRFKSVGTSPISQSELFNESPNLCNVSMETNDSDDSPIGSRKRSIGSEPESSKVQKVSPPVT